MKINRLWKASALAVAVFLPFGIYSMKTKQQYVWSWGSGRNGELGIGAQTNSSLPRNIHGIKFIDVSAGKNISAGITTDGKLYTWGKNRNGLIGHQPPNLNVLLPKQISQLSNVVQVSCGYHHICAITDKGEAYIWGINQIQSKSRQIGTTESARLTLKQVKPLKIGLDDIKYVSCAGDYTTLVNKQGKVFQMGTSRTIGKNNKQGKSATDIIELEFDQPIARVECGQNFSLALNQQGKVYVWGSNTFGQLGIGSLNEMKEPTIVSTLLRQKIVDISCGNNFAGVVTDKGQVFTWGFGNDGQLGHGDKSDQFLPRRINLDQRIRQISCGGSHTGLLTQQGSLLMMGRDREGQLGRQQNDEGSSGYSLKLKKVEQLPTNTKVDRISCGHSHTLILLESS